MMPPSLPYILFFVVTIVADVPTGRFAPECLVHQQQAVYQNLTARDAGPLTWMDIDLDEAPETRFYKVGKAYAKGINDVIAVVKEFVSSLTGDQAVRMIEHQMQVAYRRRIPENYRREIDGIARATGASTADLTMMNLFYELSRYCTSIVAESIDGSIYHGRNLDFGQLIFWQPQSHTWRLSEVLKKVTVNLRFLRDGNLLYRGTTFAGHTGLLTGMRTGAFSISLNAKLESNWRELLRWLVGDVLPPGGAHFALWTEREVLEQAASFTEAREMVSEVRQMVGGYFVLAGVNSGEGTIVVRSPKKPADRVDLDVVNGVWWLLQTNYDPGKQPLFIDDRQLAGETCMSNLSSATVNSTGLLAVLSSKTTLNKTTIHSIVMNVAKDLYETFIQRCDDPCWFL